MTLKLKTQHRTLLVVDQLSLSVLTGRMSVSYAAREKCGKRHGGLR